MYEAKINIHRTVEIRCRTTNYLGVGAIKKMAEIAEDLKGRGIERVCLVTGESSYKISGAWNYVRPALEEHSIKYTLYDRVKPNPTVDMIDEATRQCRDFDAQAVIGIGGGSPLDVGKSVAILAKYPEQNARQLYTGQLDASKALPIVTINLTHGTGTEVNRFAVASILEKRFKPAIAFDCIYPRFSIDDPGLTTDLSPNQTRYVSIDAMNHVTEAATTTLASPYSILTARETIHYVAKYLPAALMDPSDLTARYYLMYASALAGISFDNGMLHFTHALEHPLSAIRPEIPHGLGLAVLLPAMLKAIYPYTPEILAELYAPIVPNLKGVPSEADKVAQETEHWLSLMGVSQKLSELDFNEKDVPELVRLAFETPVLDRLISLSPVPAEAHQTVVQKIYEDSFRRFN